MPWLYLSSSSRARVVTCVTVSAAVLVSPQTPADGGSRTLGEGRTEVFNNMAAWTTELTVEKGKVSLVV